VSANNLTWSQDSNWLLFTKGGQLWRIKRDATGLIGITTNSGWQPDTNAETFADPTPTPTPTVPPPPILNAIVFVRPEPETGADANVWIMNPDGSNETQLTTWAGDDVAPVISPNGSQVAYLSRRNNSWTLWVMNSDGTNPIQLPLMGDNSGGLAWSPDGTQIAFSNDSEDWWEIWVVNADGTNPHRLTTHDGAAGHPSWSPDGAKLVYGVNPATNYLDLYTVNSDGTGQSLLVSSSTGFSNHQPAWSPDGTQIATVRWPAGSVGPYDLWLMNADGSSGQTLVQNIDWWGVNNLAWSADSQWLLFAKGGQLWRIKRNGTRLTQITTGGGWEPDTNAN
jgi:TolB protein